MAAYTDAGATAEAKARAYLHTNCVHCHVAGGEQGTRKFGPYSVAQTATDFCNPVCAGSATCVTPGNPTGSRIWIRDQARPGMPPIATLQTDPDDDVLLKAWITGMTCP
jgi:hypothetical protein